MMNNIGLQLLWLHINYPQINYLLGESVNGVLVTIEVFKEVDSELAGVEVVATLYVTSIVAIELVLIAASIRLCHK